MIIKWTILIFQLVIRGGEGVTFQRLKLPDIIASNTELIKVYRIPVLDCHLDTLEMSVHCNINTCNGSMNLNKNIIKVFSLNPLHDEFKTSSLLL